MREIVWDTETTGIGPEAGHRLIEIGAVEIVDKLPTGNTYHQYINPERLIEPEAIKIHGITDERVANEPTFTEIADAFLTFIGDAPLVAHNAPFDMGFLNYQLELIGKGAVSNPVVDTLPLARRKYPGARASLDALCARFEIDNTSRTFHGALLDAELLADVYLELCGGRQQGLSLTSESDKNSAEKHTPLDQLQGTPRPARTFSIPEAEQAAHRTFVTAMKQSLWLGAKEK